MFLSPLLHRKDSMNIPQFLLSTDLKEWDMLLHKTVVPLHLCLFIHCLHLTRMQGAYCTLLLLEVLYSSNVNTDGFSLVACGKTHPFFLL